MKILIERAFWELFSFILPKLLLKDKEKFDILKTFLDWDGETMSTQQAKEVVIRIPSYKSTVISIKGNSIIPECRLINKRSDPFPFCSPES